MLRRNPLAALSLQQPSMRTPSMLLSEEVPFQLDEDAAHLDSSDVNAVLLYQLVQMLHDCCIALLGN